MTHRGAGIYGVALEEYLILPSLECSAKDLFGHELDKWLNRVRVIGQFKRF